MPGCGIELTPTPPLTTFGLECPCGLVEVNVETAEDGTPGAVSFDSVESFAYQLDAEVDVPGVGPVQLDISYGGAYYAILPASRLGMSLLESPLDDLIRAARRITDAAREQLPITHPDSGAADLGFLYGTILTDDAAIHEVTGNLCIFGDGQVDRSPTGSGVTARLALDYARGNIGVGQARQFRGLSGVPFDGTIRSAHGERVVVTVAGQSYYSGQSEFVIEAEDELRDGLPIASTMAQIWSPS